jgi:ribosomal protein S18 acetylase RimI-like enzyme
MNEPAVSLRPMARTDIPAASRLTARCYRFLAERQGFSPEQRRRLLMERCSEAWVRETFEAYPRFVAEAGGRVVGLVGIEGNDIAELWVDPARHRQGIGAILFRKAKQVIADAGHTTLTVRTTGYAIPFYEVMGAHVVARKSCPGGPMVGWPLTYLEKSLEGGDNA